MSFLLMKVEAYFNEKYIYIENEDESTQNSMYIVLGLREILGLVLHVCAFHFGLTTKSSNGRDRQTDWTLFCENFR